MYSVRLVIETLMHERISQGLICANTEPVNVSLELVVATFERASMSFEYIDELVLENDICASEIGLTWRHLVNLVDEIVV